MGGGSSSSSAQNVQNDNDIMASDSAVVVGEQGSYTEKNIGSGATLIEAGATHNSGIQMGEGASLVTSSMDERTSQLLDNAMTYMYANTENILELAAQQGGGDNPTFMNPEKTTLPTKESSTKLSTGWKVGLLGAALLGLMALNGETP